MKALIWTVSSLVALLFLAVGAMKLATPAAELSQMSAGVPVVLIQIAGLAEVLGALGLVLPAATRILPVLTPVAAIGLALTMVGATITNLILGTVSAVPMTVALLAVCTGIAWARLGRYRIQPRTSTAVGSLATAHTH